MILHQPTSRAVIKRTLRFFAVVKFGASDAELNDSTS